MNAARWNVLSVEEPNAFRISRPPHSFDAQSTTSDRDRGYAFPSDYPQNSPSAFSRIATDFSQNSPHPFEPVSWLASADLTSPSFSAHDFLQRVLSPNYDKASRPTQIPVLDDAFDADAALAALDTVESALRKKREIARSEEDLARDALRKSLHLSAKKREKLVRTADTVAGNISTFSSVGRQAVRLLSEDVSGLKVSAERLASLQEARDLVSLLTFRTHELDAVRVSKLLANARKYIEDGTLATLLSEKDMKVAKEETEKCATDLGLAVYAWMKNAVEVGNTHVVRDCALAAEELNITEQFIDSYVAHILASEQTGVSEKGVTEGGIDRRDPGYTVKQFRVVCWETSKSMGEIIPTICASFSNPSIPLVSVVRMLSEKKVINAAESILSSFLRKSQGEETSSNSPDPVYLPLGRSSVERMKTLAITEAKENWRETARKTSFERKKFLTVCADIFKSVMKLKADLLSQCRVPGAENVETLFTGDEDPYYAFANRWVGKYLLSEKAWLDEQFGTAFFDITRIEAHVPRLAPRETSDADVYHRYRAFYGHISSQYTKMTKNAIESTFDALCRIITVFCTVPGNAAQKDGNVSTLVIEKTSAMEQNSNRGISAVRGFDDLSSRRVSGQKRSSFLSETEKRSSLDELEQFRWRQCSSSDLRQVLRDVLDFLVMSYLANSETILQAATHLLPVSESDAKMQELWVSGASPLTAYLQAVAILSKSNEVIDEFLLTLEICDRISEVHISSPSLSTHLGAYVPQETREVLHRELTTGLSDLGVEAQVGVRAAVAAVRARLFEMLSTEAAKDVYKSIRSLGSISTNNDDSITTKAGLELEASAAFMSASTFIEQQLQTVLSCVRGGNQDFVIAELSVITKEAVLHCWCNCEGPISVAGALQLVADGRAMMRVFRGHRESASILDCLPAVGQLFLESADGLWKCVEAKGLANVEAKALVALLKKREDRSLERVVKVCQSLGATLEEMTATSQTMT